MIPGDCVSTDQFKYRVKRRLPDTNGSKDPQKMYCGGTVVVDHASLLINIYYQLSLNDSNTIRSKNIYEMSASEMDINTTSYRGGNGVY